MLGYSRAELVGSNLRSIDSPEHARLIGPRMRELIENGTVVFDGEHVRRDGARVAVTVSGRIVSREGGGVVQSFVRDVSERRRLETEAEEAATLERQRLGRDLHDGVGQQLAGISILARTLLRSLLRTGSSEAADAEQIVQVVDEAVAQTRNLAHLLDPVPPDEMGLRTALEDLAARTSQVRGARVVCACDEDALVADNTVATHVFRIAQEAVTNAMRHARPQTISVSLRGDDVELVLAIEDDGAEVPAGFDRGSGMGIRIMRHRAGLIGGTLAIGPRPGGGLRVECRFPRGK
jgi:two-component system CheB/CheR fusion protein